MKLKHMQIGKWYAFKDEPSREYFESSCTINKSIAPILERGPFTPIEYEYSGGDGIIALKFADNEIRTRIGELPHLSEDEWSKSFIYQDEYQYFKEVERPILEVVQPEDEVQDRIVVVEGPDGNYGESGNYVVGGNDPTTFTLEKAKEHAEFVLKENAEGVTVRIFRLETIASVVSEVKFR